MSAKLRFKTKDPLWEDCFSFLVHNPRRQELEVEVRIHHSSLAALTFHHVAHKCRDKNCETG